MIQQAIAILQQAGFDLTAQELAEILWLAVHRSESEKPHKRSPQPNIPKPDPPQTQTQEIPQSPSLPQILEPTFPVTLPSPVPSPAKTTETPIRIPAAVALRNSLALGRSLRPLMRKVPSPTENILDEEATVSRIAEEKIWIPVLKPAPQRWLELALVVEQSRSTAIWKQTITELQQLLKHHGAFRDVRTWQLKVTETNAQLFPQNTTGAYSTTPHNPNVLIDPKGQRLILLVSDCISPAWRKKLIHPVLDLWGSRGLISILQLLPERLWERTALASETPVQLHSLNPGVFNSQLIVENWDENNIETQNSISIPIITLEPYPLLTWSRVIAGDGNIGTAGFKFSPSRETQQSTEPEQPQLTAPELVSRFRATASLLARRLAGLMSAAPVSLPVVQLIQQTQLKQSGQIHVAEVFMSGLLRLPQEDTNPNYIEYEFIEGVRELLLDSVPISKTTEVLEKVSEFIAERVGLSVTDFEARLLTSQGENSPENANIRPFAQLKAQVLRRLGGVYADLAEKLDPANKTPADNNGTKFFEFDVLTVNAQGQEIKREKGQASYYTEQLGDSITLEMVAIPGGKFMMGSPEGEGYDSEKPQHEVTVQPFFMGKYPVTQAQWRVIAALPRVNRDLDPDPSRFKGDNRPVESVSWYDAVEFCARLSRKTGREYRLPSEAEWEYACRAGTTTPFHFGETITDKLANYHANVTFADEPKGEYREQTTPVGNFPPNAFGLYDMHGNILEWCADAWHENYQGAPVDGSEWSDNDNQKEEGIGTRISNLWNRIRGNPEIAKNENDYRLLRGGSWDHNPENCRSAFRNRNAPDDVVAYIGFRVVCVPPSILRSP
ncbi:MAG: SUMF1/EgtB/PvdO family nonheme iron enzyme [Stigonema ocellatum SAG 48.90 = DSM 106950]|nr:SUMF1/EgtB/PvdO family nonheme iron enzyme [Stigonema ocellatum SAG 48.90 = DSM 106950]